MKFRIVLLIATLMMPFSLARALIIQVDSDNTDLYVSGNAMITALDSVSEFELWNFNGDTFVFNGYDESSYTLFNEEDHSQIVISGGSGSVITLIGGDEEVSGSVDQVSPDGSVDSGVVFGSIHSVGIVSGFQSPIVVDGSSFELDLLEPAEPVNEITPISLGPIVITPVSEPGMFMLMVLGLLSLAAFRRRF